MSSSTTGLTKLTLNFHSLLEGPLAALHTGQGPSACLWTMTPPPNPQPSSFCIQQNPAGFTSRGYQIINLEICFRPLTLKSHIPNCQKVQVEILLKTWANTSALNAPKVIHSRVPAVAVEGNVAWGFELKEKEFAKLSCIHINRIQPDGAVINNLKISLVRSQKQSSMKIKIKKMHSPIMS